MSVYVYHELQESLLCGQHCLNNLVQEPFFAIEDLAAMAQELDRLERSYITDMNDILQSYKEGTYLFNLFLFRKPLSITCWSL